MELAERQGLDEARPHCWGDHEQAVGLALVGGHLGEELVVGHAGRGGQASLLPDRARISWAIWVAEGMPFRFSVTSR